MLPAQVTLTSTRVPIVLYIQVPNSLTSTRVFVKFSYITFSQYPHSFSIQDIDQKMERTYPLLLSPPPMITCLQGWSLQLHRTTLCNA